MLVSLSLKSKGTPLFYETLEAVTFFYGGGDKLWEKPEIRLSLLVAKQIHTYSSLRRRRRPPATEQSQPDGWQNPKP